MNIDAMKVAAIKAVEKVQGAPGEPKWPAGFSVEILYEMRDEELIDWRDAEYNRYSGASSFLTAIIAIREYKLGRNARKFLRQYSEQNGEAMG